MEIGSRQPCELNAGSERPIRLEADHLTVSLQVLEGVLVYFEKDPEGFAGDDTAFQLNSRKKSPSAANVFHRGLSHVSLMRRLHSIYAYFCWQIDGHPRPSPLVLEALDSLTWLLRQSQKCVQFLLELFLL
jgi:hypothetical protein